MRWGAGPTVTASVVSRNNRDEPSISPHLKVSPHLETCHLLVSKSVSGVMTLHITLFIYTLPILSSLFCHYSEAKTVKTKPRHDPSQIFAISVGLSCSRSQKDETRANKCFTFESCEGNVRRRWGMQMVVRGQRRAT